MSKWLKIEPTRHQVAIAGHVIDEQTGNAVKGACVEITAGPQVFENWLNIRKKQYGDRWDLLDKRPDRIKTGPDGHFYFIDLPDGSYTLTALLSGAGSRYGTAQTDITVSRDAQGNINAMPLISILLPPTTIKGSITRQNSTDPVIMAEVRVKGSAERVFSNMQGEYRLTGLETGNRVVLISARGFNNASQMARLNRGIVHTLDVTLVPDT